MISLSEIASKLYENKKVLRIAHQLLWLKVCGYDDCCQEQGEDDGGLHGGWLGWAGLGLVTGERGLYTYRSSLSVVYSVLCGTSPVGCVECAKCFVF